MIILPAIDILDGKAVRLLKGDYNQRTVYSDDPVRVAKGFREAGAEYLHLVDLDGAKSGRTENLSLIERIAAESGLQVEVGGGIRSRETVETYLKAGVMRVILGTAAVTDRPLLLDVTQRYGARIAVGVDLRNGFVSTDGWLHDSALDGASFLEELLTLGVKTVICTDIAKDGALAGPNLPLYRNLHARCPSLDLIASGGVTTVEDVVALRTLGLAGAVLGKALYTGGIRLEDALEAGR